MSETKIRVAKSQAICSRCKKPVEIENCISIGGRFFYKDGSCCPGCKGVKIKFVPVIKELTVDD